MADKPLKRLVVIDGKSVFYRGYYAMPSLATKDGISTGGVFGFATMALQVIKQLRPDYVAVAWDKPKTNIRRRLQLYPKYKAGRKPAPADFYEQIPLLHNLLEALGWPLYEFDDYEADDIMGTLAVQAREKGLETILVTSDLDMLQLVNGQVKVYALKKGLSQIELYSPDSFKSRYGIEVNQFLDLKSLKGDSSDNIPGVAGVGEKTAVQLLQQYKTLDNIYDNLSLIKSTLAKKLADGREMAYLSKQLASIWTDAPLKLDLNEVDGSKINPARLMELLEKFEFRSLTRILPSIIGVDLPTSTSMVNLRPSNAQLKLIVSAAELDKLVLRPDQEYVIYTRAADKLGQRPEVLLFAPINDPGSVSKKGIEVKAVDLRGLSRSAVNKLMAKFSKVKGLVGYDLKTTYRMLLSSGAGPLPPVKHDLMISAFLLDSLRRDQSLGGLISSELGTEQLIPDELDSDQLLNQAVEILSALMMLKTSFDKQLKAEPGLTGLMQKIEWPVVPILAAMEQKGIKLDLQYLKILAENINDMISDIEQQIFGYADKEFNISSPQQLAEVLFVNLKLPTEGIKKGKSGYSTAASELDKLWLAHPIIPFIAQYREATKLKNTYIDTLPSQVDDSSRLHTTFNLTIARTGRLSSTDPNLQNIPVRTELGKHIRTAFVAGQGKKFVSADYSQFELRLAAAMSADQNMIDLFNRGVDIHQATAAEVYGRQLEDVTKEMRYAAKAVNFGILYGMSPHGLSKATHMSIGQAKEFIDKYFAARGPLLAYLENLKGMARKQGYVETLFGRRRPMPDIKSANFIVRSAAERAAMNMPIQGTEADLMKMAMIAADKAVADIEGAYQLLQIHDSILVECNQADAERVADLLQRAMENVYPDLPVNLKVDVKIGDNWGEL